MSIKQIKDDPEMQDYFRQLPITVQENLAQSGASFTNIQELKKVVWNLEKFRDDGVEKK